MQVASRSHIGHRRRVQEDSVLVDPGARFFAVADGMGGHGDGDQASQLAVGVLRAGLGKFSLEALFHAADQILLRKWPRARGSDKPRPGTTLVAARVRSPGAGIVSVEWASVGDSRVYQWDAQRPPAGRLARLSVDDTVSERCPDLRVSPEIGAMLTQAIGGHYEEEDALVVQTRAEVHARPGAPVVYLLCSDGLHGYVGDAQIERCLAGAPGDLELAAENLLGAALDAGGPDNVSVILIGF